MAKHLSVSDEPSVLVHPVLSAELFLPYLSNLKELLSTAKPSATESRSAAFVAALDGQPGRELRKRYSLQDLRNTGTYFTGSELSTRILKPLSNEVCDYGHIIDPSCGAGDLLVAAARHLPLMSTLLGTLKAWGETIVGFDINASFVAATRVRLCLLAMQRLNVGSSPDALSNLETVFPYVRTQSGLEDWAIPASRRLILSNPPFSQAKSPLACGWSQGRVSHAAIFAMVALEKTSDPGSRLVAILPDVLRTGSRYKHWRKHVERISSVKAVEILGRFDKQTDIDVFVLDTLTVRPSNKKTATWSVPPLAALTVGDLFEVNVGPVVGFRLDGKGTWRPFVHSSELPVGKTVSTFEKKIRFRGRAFKPPFVAVRRTSKADYKTRCLGTIVTGHHDLAVDDHLLIARPKDGKVTTCKALLAVLQDARTTAWMNSRIRCRHLTVSALREVPWLSLDATDLARKTVAPHGEGEA
jgi:hypothetical protein